MAFQPHPPPVIPITCMLAFVHYKLIIYHVKFSPWSFSLLCNIFLGFKHGSVVYSAWVLSKPQNLNETVFSPVFTIIVIRIIDTCIE